MSKRDKLYGAIGGATVSAIVLVALFATLLMNNPAILGVNVAQGTRTTELVTVRIKRAGTDDWILWSETHNTVATIGATYVKNFLRNNTAIYGSAGYINATDDIAVGVHGTPAIADTQLDTEQNGNGVSRASGTLTNINATAFNVTHTWTATGAVTVNATSLHYNPTAATDNNMVFIASITEATLANGDQLQVIWEIKVNDG